MKSNHIPTSRRSFCKSTAAILGTSIIGSKSYSSVKPNNPKTPLGFDNFSIRAMGWKAPRLLEYASDKKVDAILFSDLDVYESLDPSYLKEIKSEAARKKIILHAGTGGICPTSKCFKDKHGTAEEHLRLLIRVAKNLGSNVARCYLGNMKDRMGKEGIEKHISSTVKVLKTVKNYALNAGVKIAVENHAGDLHSLELIELIERAGPDFVGATIDSGNATWTLEDPVDTLRNLAPYAVSSGIRDSMVWKSEMGIKVQWTAMGEGCMNLKAFASEWKNSCPTLPLQLETISGFTKEFPIKKNDFWTPYQKIKAQGFMRFLTLAEKGKNISPFSVPKGMDKKEAQQEYQLAELERSLEYSKKELGLGIL